MGNRRLGTLVVGGAFLGFAAAHLLAWITGYNPTDTRIEIASIAFWSVVGASTMAGHVSGRTVAESVLWLTVMSGAVALLWTSGPKLVEVAVMTAFSFLGALHLRSVRKTKPKPAVQETATA